MVVSPKGKLIGGVSAVLAGLGVTYYELLPLGLDNQGIDAAVTVITSIIISYLIVDYSVARADIIHYNEVLLKFVRELVVNTGRLTENSLEEQIDKILCEKIPIGDYPGVDKYPSFTNWSTNSDSYNFYLKYLPTTEYYYFINQGFFNSPCGKSLDEGIKEKIARVYAYQSRLNNTIQDFEEELQKKYVFLSDVRFNDVNKISNKQNFDRLKNDYFETINSVFKESPYFSDLKGFVEYSNTAIKELYKQYPEIQKSIEIK
jgi:hypothetical protein